MFEKIVVVDSTGLNMAGMALLMTFMVFVVFNDLRMIF